MLVVTYSEARQNFAKVLDRTKSDGAVIITRADGSRFKIVQENQDDEKSPFDGIESLSRLPAGAVAEALKESRER